MNSVNSTKQALINITRKGSFAFLVFVSKDFFGLRPWTLDGGKVGYVSKHVSYRNMGVMCTIFVGPVCFVIYRVKTNE